MFVRMNKEMWELYIEREREENESLFLILEGKKDKRSVLNSLLPFTYHKVRNKRMACFLFYNFNLFIRYSNQRSRRHRDDLKENRPITVNISLTFSFLDIYRVSSELLASSSNWKYR